MAEIYDGNGSQTGGGESQAGPASSYAGPRSTTAMAHNVESYDAWGADYDRSAGITGLLHSHNLATAYGHNLIGNTSQKRAAALRTFVGLGPMVEGSLCQLRRGERPRWQLTDRPAGKTRTLYVPAGRAEEVRQWTANWRKARQLLRDLSDASREELRARGGRAGVAQRPRRTAAPARRS